MSKGSGGVTELLRGRGVHLGSLPAVLADRYGDRPAVIDEQASPGLHPGGPRSYRELEDHTARLAAVLRQIGVAEEDRVLVAIGNRIDVVLFAFALARIGAVPAPVNARLKARELAAVAEAAGAARAIVDEGARPTVREAGGLEAIGTDELADALRSTGERHLREDRDPDATALLLATSGTTGLPKAAALTSHGLLAALGRLTALPVGRRSGPRAGRDLVLAALPLTHVMGFEVVIGTLCAGVPLLLRPHFDPEEALDLLERERPNVFIGVPTMYADLEAAGAGERDLSSIQVWGSAADAMPPDRARRFQHYGAAYTLAGRSFGTAIFVDIYGMVELSGAAAVRLYPPAPIGEFDVPSVGVVLPGMEVRAVDGDGSPVSRGSEGELQFRGSGVLQGYEGREDAGPDDDGWFATGDHGRLRPGGVFVFSGRDRDRLKVGGFSVFPAEVEEELRDAPEVAEVALVGVVDDRLGERPVALVVPTDGSFDPEAFLAWAADNVAGYRRPRDVLVVDGIPRGNHGKIDRAAATAIAEERLAQDPRA